jgi:hypothetical protein
VPIAKKIFAAVASVYIVMTRRPGRRLVLYACLFLAAGFCLTPLVLIDPVFSLWACLVLLLAICLFMLVTVAVLNPYLWLLRRRGLR